MTRPMQPPPASFRARTTTWPENRRRAIQSRQSTHVAVFQGNTWKRKPVSGLKAVEETDKAVGNLDYDEQNPQKAHPYAFGFYNGFANSVVNQMKAEHMGTEFEKASDRPDQYAEPPH